MFSVFEDTIQLTTSGEGDIINLTPFIMEVIDKSEIKTGVLNLFVEGSTAAVTTIEYESGVLMDFKEALSKIAPENIAYSHDMAWGDGNGRSHVKAAIIGPSLEIPIRSSKPALGVWQQPVLVELDVKEKRNRRIHCTVTGIKKETEIKT
ncbi:secondary thiamine-phosphate synthase enzyme YjbQ [Methanomicrobium antiquum]|uniref:Secondary thiamine-phosphate synthase enzyme YjbQ n=1 Tax=Methanomicrobium antiquum TaxID=487686 RepID=A0AAF0FW43_9EURY|nr:secondary thiamine-phosphate synthase enzyme YjbQ [Methanomicrobium antiquum]WFN36064.1 secondary thiamine-phosphate synthase enzyme YjbQ [Methanomicrobium antiquum]